MVSDTCTSSNRRPLVSGTSITTNGMVKKHMLENMKNVPARNILLVVLNKSVQL